MVISNAYKTIFAFINAENSIASTSTLFATSCRVVYYIMKHAQIQVTFKTSIKASNSHNNALLLTWWCSKQTLSLAIILKKLLNFLISHFSFNSFIIVWLKKCTCCLQYVIKFIAMHSIGYQFFGGVMFPRSLRHFR